MGNIVKQETTAIAATEQAKYKELIEGFIKQLDVKESSRGLYKRTLWQFFVYIQEGKRKMNELTRQDVLDYKDYLLKRNLSSLTVSSYLVIVRNYFAWLEAEKIYPNIAKGIKTPRRIKDRKTNIKEQLTADQTARLLAHFEAESLRNYAIVNLMLRTGLRTIEVARLDVGDIEQKGERRIIRVWGKGRDEKDDFVVLTDKAYLPIKNYLAATRKKAKDNEPLFTANSHLTSGTRLSTRIISRICKEGLRAIGLDNHQYTAHSLRHTTGCTLIEAGASLDDVQRTMRHESPETTLRYVNKVQQDMHLRNAAETLLDDVF